MRRIEREGFVSATVQGFTGCGEGGKAEVETKGRMGKNSCREPWRAIRER